MAQSECSQIHKYTQPITSVTSGDGEFTLNLSTRAVDIGVRDIIGVFDIEAIEGFYTVKSIVGDAVTVTYEETIDDIESSQRIPQQDLQK